jgi:hypothetical protein
MVGTIDALPLSTLGGHRRRRIGLPHGALDTPQYRHSCLLVHVPERQIGKRADAGRL